MNFLFAKFIAQHPNKDHQQTITNFGSLLLLPSKSTWNFWEIIDDRPAFPDHSVVVSWSCRFDLYNIWKIRPSTCRIYGIQLLVLAPISETRESLFNHEGWLEHTSLSGLQSTKTCTSHPSSVNFTNFMFLFKPLMSVGHSSKSRNLTNHHQIQLLITMTIKVN